MLISVIVPTRNRSSDLLRALRGIQEQDYGEFEVIVIDDGSEEAVRQGYAQMWTALDARFQLVCVGAPGQKGMGPSASRNMGIERARGEVVAFCDDDDFWCEPRHLSLVAQTFAQHPDTDMYIGNQRAVSVDGSVKPDWLPVLCQRVRGRTPLATGAYLVSIEDLCAAGGFAQLNILILRRQVLRQIQGFWVRTSYEEDRDLFWRAADKCRAVAFNPLVVAQHNVPNAVMKNNQSTTHSHVDRWLIAILVCQHVIANAEKPLICALNTQYTGDLLRKLAVHFEASGDSRKAIQFAWLALGARFSFKWAGYGVWLWLRRFTGVQGSGA